jgi:hypothetical protein
MAVDRRPERDNWQQLGTDEAACKQVVLQKLEAASSGSPASYWSMQ